MRLRPTNVLIGITLPAIWPAVAPFLPFRQWLVDVPACFVVQAAGCLLGTAAVLAIARRGCWAVCYLVFGLVASAAVLPTWFAARALQRTEGAPLRVLSLNLLRGNEAAAPAAIAVVRQHAPDVLFCSEVTPGWLGALQSALTDYPYRHAKTDEGYFGVAVFSKLPLTDVAVVPLGFAWAPALRAVVQTATEPVGMLGIHVPRPGIGRRCTERDQALAAIPGELAALPEAQVVLGDFNATPWNQGFAELLAATGLQNATGAGFLPTWTTAWPWPLRVPIDHVLVRGGIGVAAVHAGPLFGSDHAPVFADLRLPNGVRGK